MLRQELVERGVPVSIRNVERSVSPLWAEAMNAERATLRFETDPGQQMQIDFGEKWIEVAGERVKAFVFVATLGYCRSTFAQVYPTLRQRHWLEGQRRPCTTSPGCPRRAWWINSEHFVGGGTLLTGWVGAAVPTVERRC